MTISFGLSDEWTMWNTGLDTEQIAHLADGALTSTDSNDRVAEVIRMIDEQAQSDVGSLCAAVWLPEKGGEPRGSLRVWYHTVARPKDASWEQFLKAARKPPKTNGVVLKAYSVDMTSLSAGPTVIQYLETYEVDTGPLLSTFRATIFPEDRSAVYVLNFEIVFPLLLDEFEDAVVEVLDGVSIDPTA